LGRVVALPAVLVITCSIALGCGEATTCEQANSVLLDNINSTMNDPSEQLKTAFVSKASNLQGPPIVKRFVDPVWVAAQVPGRSGEPALWLAEKAGDGFAYVANDSARVVNYSGAELGGPPLDGDGEQAALKCAGG